MQCFRFSVQQHRFFSVPDKMTKMWLTSRLFSDIVSDISCKIIGEFCQIYYIWQKSRTSWRVLPDIIYLTKVANWFFLHFDVHFIFRETFPYHTSLQHFSNVYTRNRDMFRTRFAIDRNSCKLKTEYHVVYPAPFFIKINLLP